MLYTVKTTTKSLSGVLDWDAWSAGDTASLKNVRPEGSGHVPDVQCRLLHDNDTIYGLYQVKDQYIKVTHLGYQNSVCQDSCVEFFFKPSAKGYFNLEMSAGGSYLFYYVRDNSRTPTGFKDYSPVDEKYGKLVQVTTTLPHEIPEEITEPKTWYCQFTIPKAAIEPYCGEIGKFEGQEWTCNFYKCGDKTSHPHWLSWSPVPVLNFHIPEAFDKMVFA